MGNLQKIESLQTTTLGSYRHSDETRVECGTFAASRDLSRWPRGARVKSSAYFAMRRGRALRNRSRDRRVLRSSRVRGAYDLRRAAWTPGAGGSRHVSCTRCEQRQCQGGESAREVVRRGQARCETSPAYVAVAGCRCGRSSASPPLDIGAVVRRERPARCFAVAAACGGFIPRRKQAPSRPSKLRRPSHNRGPLSCSSGLAVRLIAARRTSWLAVRCA
jgi:hypothetical protein